MTSDYRFVYLGPKGTFTGVPASEPDLTGNRFLGVQLLRT